MIVDFHCHTFPDKIAAATLEFLSGKSHSVYYTDGTTDGLSASMQKAGADQSVNLPVITKAGQARKVNHGLYLRREELEKQGIISFAGIHPENENWKEELKLIKEEGFVGLKLHPSYQGVDLNDIRYLRIIEEASALDLIITVHCGIDLGILGHNYASVDHILQVLQEAKPAKLVCAHMGNWDCWDQVESDLCGAPVWFDTAFSLGEVRPKPGTQIPPYRLRTLENEDFVRICRKHGTDRILFGTDSPWEDQAEDIRKIRESGLTAEECDAVLGDNAERLLKL